MISSLFDRIRQAVTGDFDWLLPLVMPESSATYGANETPDTEWCRAAVHEAGHVVTAWSCSRVDAVSDVQIQYGSGQTRYQHRFANEGDSIWCQLVLYMAGPAAEAMVYRRWRSLGSASDLDLARSCAEKLSRLGCTKSPWSSAPASSADLAAAFRSPMGKAESDVLRRGFTEAQRVVTAHGPAFYKIVGALLQRRSLAAADLAAYLPNRDCLKALRSARPVFLV